MGTYLLQRDFAPRITGHLLLRRKHEFWRVLRGAAVLALLLAVQGACLVWGQTAPPSALGDAVAARRRAQQFLAGREVAPSFTLNHPGLSTSEMRSQLLSSRPLPRLSPTNLSTPWQQLGPTSVTSALYGPITGRITAVAIDPKDTTGNTVWLGTTGGGVWKSTNAAGPLTNVSFAPLTDDLAAFQTNAVDAGVPSLSIGAIAIQPAAPGVILVGTGDPNDATDSYYGEGIMRSADGGLTWTVVSVSHDEGIVGGHSFIGVATAGLAWSTASPSTVVAAITTSLEGYIVQASTIYDHIAPGLYYSSDAGLTWHIARAYDGDQVVQESEPLGVPYSGTPATTVVWDPQRNLFIAALAFHGYYSSPDGQTWQRLANQPGAGLTTTNCPVGIFGQGSLQCPILRGTLAVQPATGDLYALTVDLDDKDQGVWQDLCAAGPNGSCATASPTFATRVDGGAMEVGQGASGRSTVVPQGSYNLALAAAPDSHGGTVLFAGAIDVYRCSLAPGSSACVLRNTTNAGNACNAPAAVAPAQHALAAVGQNAGNPLLFIGNDGGLWRSTDGIAQTGAPCAATDASHFDNLNPSIAKGGSLAEVVGFAQDPASPNILLAGLGSNGSAASSNATSLQPWPQLSAGEGGFPLIDPVTPTNWFVATGAAVSLNLCPHGASCTAQDFLPPATIGAPQTAKDIALIDPPVLLDPQLPSSVITATCRVWRGPAQGGSSWSTANALSPSMDSNAVPCVFNNITQNSFIRSLGAGGPANTTTSGAQAGSQVLYAGMAGVVDGGGGYIGGHVFVTRSANTASSRTAWTDIAESPVPNSLLGFNSGQFDISSITVDPHDPTGATVYLTVMGFGNGQHVYRSTDFGANWLNITSNILNAPANSLAIDPNNANTIYVATDIGVYVTQNVSSCSPSGASCWSPLGTGLPNAPVTSLAVGGNLPTGDGRLGMLRAGTYGRGLWQIPLVSAVSLNQPALAISPTTLVFGAQAVATESAKQTITLTSNGSAPVAIRTLAITGDFVETDTCAGQTLTVGSTCTINVQFAPTATGARSGLLTVYANIPGGQVTANLSGTATAAAAVVLTPLQLTFPATEVHQKAPSQIITVSNTGGNPATFSPAAITGDFSISANTCGASLPSQTGCSIAIVFQPTTNGTRTGTLTITDSAGVQIAQLSGLGTSPATDTVSPAALSFAQVQIGASSAAQQVTLTNAGDVALTLVNAKILNGDFVTTNHCGSSLTAHSTCTISVAFVPTAVGSRSGVLQISDEFREQTVTLSGSGLAPAGVSLTPSSIDFGTIGVGLQAPAATLVLTNNGGVPLSLASTAVTGDFTLTASTCGTTVAPGSACNLSVIFAPTAAGTREGTLTLTDTATPSTQIISFTGIGIDFALAANGATSVTVSSGTSATFPLLLSSQAGLNGSVAFSCTGAPANTVCTVSPTTGALGSTVPVSVVLQTGLQTTTAARAPGRPAHQNRDLVLFGLMPLAGLGFGRARRKAQRAASALMLAVLGLVLWGAVSGCGAGRAIPLSGPGSGTGTGGGSSTPTKSGIYPIVVTGTAAGVTHKVNLTLIVQ